MSRLLSALPRLGACTVAAWLAFGASPLAAQSRDRDRDDDGRQREADAFRWNGVIPQGKRILIKNINGPIRVEKSSGDRVEVTAEKRWRRGDPDDVRIEQKSLAGDEVVICALWHEEARCEEGGIRSPRTRWNDRNDVSVHFVVRVPNGVRVDVNTVNGSVDVDGVNTDVRAATVNGSIDAASAGGPVRAKTVNGSIRVSMGSTGTEDLEYETVNGAITIELPSGTNAQFDLSVVNGRISTDFPVTVTGSLSTRRLRGSVGDGGPRLRASTVNGGITLRKR